MRIIADSLILNNFDEIEQKKAFEFFEKYAENEKFFEETLEILEQFLNLTFFFLNKKSENKKIERFFLCFLRKNQIFDVFF